MNRALRRPSVNSPLPTPERLSTVPSMGISLKIDPETGAELLLLEKPFHEDLAASHVWIDDEGREYPLSATEIADLGLLR